MQLVPRRSTITAFGHPHDYGEHFKAKYGPTITAQANARKNGQEAEFVEALDSFCDEWNRGTPEQARFEQEYLVVAGTRCSAARPAPSRART